MQIEHIRFLYQLFCAVNTILKYLYTSITGNVLI